MRVTTARRFSARRGPSPGGSTRNKRRRNIPVLARYADRSPAWIRNTAAVFGSAAICRSKSGGSIANGGGSCINSSVGGGALFVQTAVLLPGHGRRRGQRQILAHVCGLAHA